MGENVSLTKLSRLSHKVCRLLSSPVLLRKPTTVQWITQLDSLIYLTVSIVFTVFLIVFWPPVYPL